MSASNNNAKGGEFASARRGAIDPSELAFVAEKRALGVSDFTIANMIGRPVTTVRMIPRTLAAETVEPEIVEEPVPAPLPVVPRKPTVSCVKINRKARLKARAMPKRIRVMVEAIAIAHGLTLEDLLGDSTARRTSVARHEAFALIYGFLKPSRTGHLYSLPLIGSWFGGRDHTTVRHGVHTHQRRVAAREADALWEVAA